MAPPKVLRRLVEAVPGYWLERVLRRLGRKRATRISFEQGSLRIPSMLHVGDDAIQPESVEAVALQGWQEEFGHERVWDVMLLGPDKDVVVGYASYEVALDLATKLADVLGVQVRESSVVGGSLESPQVGSLTVRDMRYDAPKPDGWGNIK